MAKKNYKYRKINSNSFITYSNGNTTFHYGKRKSQKSTSILYSAIKIALQNKKVIIAVPYKERIWSLEDYLKKIVFDFSNKFTKEDQKLIKQNIEIEPPSYFKNERYRGYCSPLKKQTMFIDESDEFFSKLTRRSIDEILFNFNIEKAVSTPVVSCDLKMNYIHKKLGLKKRKTFLHKNLQDTGGLFSNYHQHASRASSLVTLNIHGRIPYSGYSF